MLSKMYPVFKYLYSPPRYHVVVSNIIIEISPVLCIRVTALSLVFSITLYWQWVYFSKMANLIFFNKTIYMYSCIHEYCILYNCILKKQKHSRYFVVLFLFIFIYIFSNISFKLFCFIYLIVSCLLLSSA